MVAKPLHQVVDENAKLIVDRFVAKAREYDLPPQTADRSDVIDDLQRYVRHAAASFHRGDGEQADATAKAHGEQRWYVGYDLKSVILEYGQLRSAIVEVVEQTGYRMTAQEVDQVAAVLNAGVAAAAVEFTKRSTQQLNEALTAAQVAVRAREEVVAVVSHDLKNPLGIIGLATPMLSKMLDGEDLDTVRAPLQKMVSRIERASKRMNCLITDLLDLAKIREGRVELDLREERTSDLLDEACEQAGAMADQSEVRLIQRDVAQAIVACDPERVMQVFDNILGNAIKFSPKRATIWLGVKHSDAECTFSIRDEGPGIPDEHLPLLFDRFWTAPRSTAASGTGLGLAIAKGIVEAHRGRIWVESMLGQGTSFFFTLPCPRG